jgi:hypothetical protein
MDAYLGWRDECDAVSDAYARWSAADEADCASAFKTYATALDREESAAERYAELMQLVQDLRVPGSEPRLVLAAAAQDDPR